VHRSYEIGQTCLGVRANSPVFGDWLDRHLARYEIADALPPYYSVYVADDRLPGKRFHILYEDTRPIVRTADLGALGYALVRELETLVFPARDDAVYAMTPLVSVGATTGIVPPGLVPLIGTLGSQVQRAGLVLPLESAVAIDLESALVAPIRPVLGVPDTAFESLSPNGGPHGHPMVDLPHPVDVLFSIGDGEPLLQPTSKGVALYRLAHYGANLPRVGRRGFEALGRVVAAAECIEIRADERRVMLGAIVSALEHHGGRVGTATFPHRQGRDGGDEA